MDKNNPLIVKSENFSYRIYKMAEFLQTQRLAQDIVRQVLRSGTSVGANIAEGYYAQSDADILAKFSIALKEAGETSYWLRLIHRIGIVSDEQFSSIYADSQELIRLLVASIKTIKGRGIEKKEKRGERK